MKSKTTILKGETTKRNWHLVDLADQVLGRVTPQIAHLLMGKTKSTFSYHRDDGDYVVAINSDKVRVTGKKLKQKMYQHYTGHPGGLREFSLQALMTKDSRQVIYHAVLGMLPKNKLRDRRLTRLKIFVGPQHPYGEKIK